ncbi:hypothetical protein CEXT_625701 [Caerostris extrusa]|uniref:Uncharacterized protein n=1 Tax=Caerostris extrusa TaxID=172846 RepID=A0AAV4MB37_CAEEX|nr:hypothetical protein CEXT_625701 [Caerostris extrusa]
MPPPGFKSEACGTNGKITCPNHMVPKVSRPEQDPNYMSKSKYIMSDHMVPNGSHVLSTRLLLLDMRCDGQWANHQIACLKEFKRGSLKCNTTGKHFMSVVTWDQHHDT